MTYIAKSAHEVGREEDVEIVVAEWGSVIPLSSVVKLSPEAAKIISFLAIPPGVAQYFQKDSPFSEVHAINAAARRANGKYIGRIDQDTLVGTQFLKTIFEMLEDTMQMDIPLDSALLFANQRMVPYRFAVRCPSLWAVDRFICWFGRFLPNEISSRDPFYCNCAGIWLLHKNLWYECGGYDERMIYMNDMETNIINRLMKKYKIVDLGKLVNYDFYHLEHYHPRAFCGPSAHRKVNPKPFHQPDVFHPNSDNWGLNHYPLEVLTYSPKVGVLRKANVTSRY